MPIAGTRNNVKLRLLRFSSALILFILAVAAYAVEIRRAFAGSLGMWWDRFDFAGLFCIASIGISLLAFRRRPQRRSIILLILGGILFVIGEYVRVGGEPTPIAYPGHTS